MPARIRHLRACGVASCLLALTMVAAAGPRAPSRRSPPATPAPRQSAADSHHYAITARVRPILFWIDRNSVGEARLTWMSGPNHERGYELLIGSDPGRAPKGINQWGYVRETEEQGTVRVLGLMTQYGEEQSFEDAKAASERPPSGSQMFKVFRATVGDGGATTTVQRLALSDRLTFRDLEAVLAQVPGPGPSDSATIAMPPGTEPGFLFAMTSLIHANVQECLKKGNPPVATRRTYVFGRKLYTVWTRASHYFERTSIKGREYRKVIQSEFEARPAAEPKGETFRVVYGTDGALREVPIRIVYRANFWFEAEVVLVEDAGVPLPR
jgi:hypothetical protein